MPGLDRTWTCSTQQLHHKHSMDLMRTFRAHNARYGVDEDSQDSGADQGSGVAVKYARYVTPVCPATAACQGIQRTPCYYRRGPTGRGCSCFVTDRIIFCSASPEVRSKTDSEPTSRSNSRHSSFLHPEDTKAAMQAKRPLQGKLL
jgi:hypothetical protein